MLKVRGETSLRYTQTSFRCFKGLGPRASSYYRFLRVLEERAMTVRLPHLHPYSFRNLGPETAALTLKSKDEWKLCVWVWGLGFRVREFRFELHLG